MVRRCLWKILASCLFIASFTAILLPIMGDYDPVEMAVSLHNEGKRDLALDVIGFSLENQHGNESELNDLKEKYKYGITEKTKDCFYNGAVKGEVYNTWSGIGCIASDLFILGDIRDISKEGYHYFKGDEVDVVVSSLSGLGVATTASGPIGDAGFSLIKTTVKYVKRTIKVVPESILKTVIKSKKLSIDSYSKLWDIFKNGGYSIQSFTSTLSKVKNIDRLGSISKIVSKLGPGGYIFIEKTGENGIKFFEKYGNAVLTSFRKNPSQVIGATKLHAMIGFSKFTYENGIFLTVAISISACAFLLSLFPIWVPIGVGFFSLSYLFNFSPYRYFRSIYKKRIKSTQPLWTESP